MTRWEYIQRTLLWTGETLILEDGSKLEWADAWVHFNELGDEGWELISITPVSNQPIVSPTKDTPVAKSLLSAITGGLGYTAGKTEVLLFVFKRPKS